MKKSLEKKIEKYVKSTSFPFAKYYTECPINYNDDYEYDIIILLTFLPEILSFLVRKKER